MISVIVPTIKGREEYLHSCRAAYAAHTEDYELIVVPDRPTCGEAWVSGSRHARGDYIHFSADDLRPHSGWWRAAVSVCDRGFLPAPRILNDDGTLQSCGGTDGWETELQTGQQTDFSRIPFLSRAQWDEVHPLVEHVLARTHYYTDNAVGFAAATLGISTGVHRDYLFRHSLAGPGRGAGTTWQDRMTRDFQAFEEWASGLQPNAVL